MAAGDDHIVEGPADADDRRERTEVGRVTVAANLAVGERLRLVKFLAYGYEPALAPSRSRHGRRGTRRDPTQRLGRFHRRPAQVPDDFWARGRRA